MPITNDNITEEIEKFDLIITNITIPPSLESRVSVGGKAVGRIIDKSSMHFYGLTIALMFLSIVCYVVLLVEFADSRFIGSESSKQVIVVIKKSNAVKIL